MDVWQLAWLEFTHIYLFTFLWAKSASRFDAIDIATAVL